MPIDSIRSYVNETGTLSKLWRRLRRTPPPDLLPQGQGYRI
jgi:hypothetical protein